MSPGPQRDNGWQAQSQDQEQHTGTSTLPPPDAGTSRRLADQEALMRVGQAAAQSLELATVLREVARTSIGIAGAEASGVYLWLPDEHAFEVGFEETIPEWPTVLEPGTRLPADRWPTAVEAIRTQSHFSLRTEDPRLSDSERNRYRETGVGSVLCLPLVMGDQTLGCLKLFTRAAHDFTEREVQLGYQLAAHAARAITNARLIEESRKIAADQAAMVRVGQAAISSLDLQTVLREIARAAIGLASAERCGIVLWPDGCGEAELAAGATAADWPSTLSEGVRIPLDHMRCLRRLSEDRAPLILWAEQPVENDIERELLLRDGARTILLAPLVVGEECLGGFAFLSRRSNAFTDESIRIAREVAALTALAIQNARLLRRAQGHSEEQAALLRVTQAVISGEPLPDVLEVVARSGLVSSPAEVCEISLWQERDDEIEIAAVQTVAGRLARALPGQRIPLDDRPTTRRAMETGEAQRLVIDDPGVAARERATYVFEGTRAALIVPLMLGTECLGCLTLTTSQGQAFGWEAIRFIGELAAQASQAIDRARLFTAIQQRADTDGLTKLLNHRALQERLDADLEEARDLGRPLSVILIDLDDFKLFNDTHGHLVGDRVLVEVAALIRNSVRADDRVGRYGGDEFLLVLPGADGTAAREVAARIHSRFGTFTIKIEHLRLPLKLSIGVASYPEDGRTRQTLIAQADAAMYAAKHGHRRPQGGLEQAGDITPYGALLELVRAIDDKDRYTKGHSDRVAELGVALGQELDLSPDQLDAIEIAGRLHDVGKIAVPDAILRKPAALSEEEEASLRQHVLFSTLMVQGVPHQAAVVAAIASHHEWWNGAGYPAGMSGAEIPLLARILALADAFAAMTQDRPFRKGLTLPQAITELRRQAGSQFDPDLVEPFIRIATQARHDPPDPFSPDDTRNDGPALRLVSG